MQGATVTDHSTAHEKVRQVISGAATLFTVRVNSKASSSADFFLQVHDSATLPTDVTTMLGCYKCFAGGSFVGDEFGSGIPITNGIYLVASQADDAVTQIAAAEAWFLCGYTTR